jgi:HK97 family phage portal protein
MDWEYSPVQAEQMGMEWLEDRKFSVSEIARFFDVPGDLIDASVSGQSVTYANITERNLQFLTMSLAPAIARREDNLSRLTGRDRFIKFNTNAMLRMDPLNRNKAYALALQFKWLTNDEVRALEDRKPLSQSDIEQFETLYGAAQQKSPLALTTGGTSPNE